MNGKKALMILMAIFVVRAFLPAASSAAVVSIFAECAYSEDDLVCYIYTNSEGNSLISGGVKLVYKKAELNTPEVTKNVEQWYMGDGTSAGNKDYMNPEIDETSDPNLGKIVFIVGRLDTVKKDGLDGSRLLIGTVRFARKNSADPSADPIAFFDLSITKGREAPYINFVNTAGDDDLDPAGNGALTVAERCDTNASGGLSPRDITALKVLLNGDDYVVYADCNDSETLTPRDITALKVRLQ